MAKDNPKDGYGGPIAGGSFDSGEEKPKGVRNPSGEGKPEGPSNPEQTRGAQSAEGRQPTANQAVEEQARAIGDYLRNMLPGGSILSQSDEIVPPQVPGKGGGRQL